MLPAGFDQDSYYDVLIALHGHWGDRFQGVSDWTEFRAMQDAAAEHEMIYISPDYRATTSWMGPAAEADVVQIIAMLKSQYNVKRVFITGASMGGASCLTFTALHPDLIAGVASMNGMANFFEYDEYCVTHLDNEVLSSIYTAIRESFGGSPDEVPGEYEKRSAESWPEHFSMPLAIAASRTDGIVPPQSVIRLADSVETLGGTVRLLVSDNGHATSYDEAREVVEFVIDNAAPWSGPTGAVPAETRRVHESGNVVSRLFALSGRLLAGQEQPHQSAGTTAYGMHVYCGRRPLPVR